jgi:hypothetical protein
MGNVNIPYYTTRQREGCPAWGYWAPCLKRRNPKTGKIEPTLMAELGFQLVDCGQDGPAAWAIAQSWNRKWKHARAEHKAGRATVAPGKIERVYPPNSMGEGFAKFRTTGEWHGKPQSTRDQWMRGWRYIEPIFGDVDGRTVAMENIDLWYNGDPNDPSIQGLVLKHGVSEAYLAMKYWRAIYSVLATINRADGKRYCEGKDPSLGIRRKTPPKRNAIYREGEAVRLVKRAIREKFYGLAAALAVAWDTQFSPVDVRSITLAKLYPDAAGPIFGLDRAKTGKTALGTLSKRTARLLWAYIDYLVGNSPLPNKAGPAPRAALPAGENVRAFKLHQDRPIFHTRGTGAGPKGGRPRAPALYTKDTFSKDFRIIRALEFPAEEKLPPKKRRKVMDFRRSGAIEAVAGKVDPAHLAGKMANSIDTNKTLQDTYLPQHASVVRLADAARLRGRRAMRESVKPNENGA